MVSRGGEKIEKFGRACQKREGKPALCYAESGEIGGSGTGRGEKCGDIESAAFSAVSWRLHGPGACRADVLLPDRADIVLSFNQILQEYTLSSGEKKTVQDFLDSLMAEGSRPASF